MTIDTRDTTEPPEPPEPRRIDLASLLSRRLLFVTGKGGVGKSVVTAAVGLAAARTGRRVLLCDLDQRPTFCAFFGLPDVGDEPVEVERNLWVTRIDPQAALMDFIARLVPSRRIVGAIVKNRIIKAFFSAAPAVNEVASLHRLYRYSGDSDRGRRWDMVVVDMPATGHAVTYLRVPQIMARLIRLGFAARLLEKIDARIRDHSVTGVLLVTLPEELPVNETVELWQKLTQSLGLIPDGVVINCVHGSPVSDDRQDLLRDLSTSAPRGKDAPDGPEHRLLHGGGIGLDWSSRDRYYVQLLRRLLPGPFAEIPFYFDKLDDGQLVRDVADQLYNSLTGPA